MQTYIGRISNLRSGTTSGGKGVTNFGLAIQGDARAVLQDGKAVEDSQGRALFHSKTTFVNCALFHNVDADRLVGERLRIGMKVQVEGEVSARAFTREGSNEPEASLQLVVDYVGPHDHRSLLAFCGREENPSAQKKATQKTAKASEPASTPDEDIS